MSSVADDVRIELERLLLDAPVWPWFLDHSKRVKLGNNDFVLTFSLPPKHNPKADKCFGHHTNQRPWCTTCGQADDSYFVDEEHKAFCYQYLERCRQGLIDPKTGKAFKA